MSKDKKSTLPKRARQAVYVDLKTEQRMDEIAEELGVSKSEITREALKKFIRGYEYEGKGYEVGAVLEKEGVTKFVLF